MFIEFRGEGHVDRGSESFQLAPAAQIPSLGDRHQPDHRLTVAGDDDILAGESVFDESLELVSPAAC